MRRLHTRIVLEKERRGSVKSYLIQPELCTVVCVSVYSRVVDKLPQVSVQVFQHSVLVLNCLEYSLHHVRAVTVAMWRVRTCTNKHILLLLPLWHIS